MRRKYMIVPGPAELCPKNGKPYLFERYSGRPVQGGDEFSKFVDGKAADIDMISERMSETVRAAETARNAISRHADCQYGLSLALISYFSNQRGWTRHKVERALSGFNANGFASSCAKDFAMFVRGMFFDDSLDMYRAISCVGLYEDSTYGSTDEYFAVATFEDSKTGNQFALSLPFPAKESPMSKNSRFAYENLAYSLSAPRDSDVFDDGVTVAASYDPRIMRMEVDKFVSSGCIIHRTRYREEEYMVMPFAPDSTLSWTNSFGYDDLTTSPY